MSATKLLAAFAALTSLAAATPTWSAPDPDLISVTVKVGDLNLATEHGARAAFGRIRQAANVICGEAPAPQALQQGIRYRECMHSTVGGAVVAANQPMLTAVAGHYDRQVLLAAR